MSGLLLALSDGAKKGLMFGLLGVVLVGMILFSIFSNRKNKKNAETLNSQIKVGARVKTMGGLLGYITQVNVDNTIIINCGTEETPNYVCIIAGAVVEILVPAPKTPEEIAAEKEAERLLEEQKKAKSNAEEKKEEVDEEKKEEAVEEKKNDVVEEKTEEAKEEVVEEKKEEVAEENVEAKKENAPVKKSATKKK